MAVGCSKCLRLFSKKFLGLFCSLLLLYQMVFWKTSNLYLFGSVDYTKESGDLIYVLQRPPMLAMDRVDSLTPMYTSSFQKSLQDSFHKLQRRFPNLETVNLDSQWSSITRDEITSDQFYAFQNDRNSEKLKAALLELLNIITVPRRTCKKLVTFGGAFCNRRREGAKMICMDEDVKPNSDEGIVYSFGIGHDFSFDLTMSSYGSNVYSFDDDQDHAKYNTPKNTGVTFIHIRLGPFSYVTEREQKGTKETILYRPIHSIMKALSHRNETIDIIKMDIENSEWNVFEGSFFKTKVLEKTKQLSLEIHMEVFKNQQTNTTTLLNAAQRYTRVLRSLEKRGFLLTHYEPNYFSPKVREVMGLRFHIYCETLWINSNYVKYEKEDPFEEFYRDYEYPPNLLPSNMSQENFRNQSESMMNKVMKILARDSNS